MKDGVAIFCPPKCGSFSVLAMLADMMGVSVEGKDWHGVEKIVLEEWTKVSPTEAFAASAFTIAVHRDPIERLKSTYRHRVLELEEWEGSYPEFTYRLDNVRKDNSSILWHTAPMHRFLGKDHLRFSAVIPLSNIADLPTVLRRNTLKSCPELPHLHNTSGRDTETEIAPAVFIPIWVAEDYKYSWNGTTRHE